MGRDNPRAMLQGTAQQQGVAKVLLVAASHRVFVPGVNQQGNVGPRQGLVEGIAKFVAEVYPHGRRQPFDGPGAGADGAMQGLDSVLPVRVDGGDPLKIPRMDPMQSRRVVVGHIKRAQIGPAPAGFIVAIVEGQQHEPAGGGERLFKGQQALKEALVRPPLFDLLPRDAGGVQIKAELGALHGMREFAQGRIDPDPRAAVAETKQMHMAIPEIIGAQAVEDLLGQPVVSQ